MWDPSPKGLVHDHTMLDPKVFVKVVCDFRFPSGSGEFPNRQEWILQG